MAMGYGALGQHLSLEANAKSTGGYSDTHSNVLAGLLEGTWDTGDWITIGAAYVLETCQPRAASFSILCAIASDDNVPGEAFTVK